MILILVKTNYTDPRSILPTLSSDTSLGYVTLEKLYSKKGF